MLALEQIQAGELLRPFQYVRTRTKHYNGESVQDKRLFEQLQDCVGHSLPTKDKTSVMKDRKKY